MKKSMLLFLCVLLAFSVLLTACGGNEGGTSTPDGSSAVGESNVDSGVPGGKEDPSSDGYIDEPDSSDSSKPDSPIKPQGSTTTAGNNPGVSNTTTGSGITKQPTGNYDPYAGVTCARSGRFSGTRPDRPVQRTAVCLPANILLPPEPT